MVDFDVLQRERPTIIHDSARQRTARALLGKDVEEWRKETSLTQKLLAEKAQRMLRNARVSVKLTAAVISDLELGSTNATRLTVRQLRAIAHVLGGAFIVRQSDVEQPVSDSSTKLETLFGEGAQLSIEDPNTD